MRYLLNVWHGLFAIAFLGLLLQFIVVSGKNLPFVLLALMGLTIVVGGFRYRHADERCRRRLGTVVSVLIVLTWISLFSPVDVCIRQTDHFSARISPIICVRDSREAVRRAEAAGQRENVDFVVYRGNTLLGEPRWAIVTCVPGSDR
jgi:hypothetical protein